MDANAHAATSPLWHIATTLDCMTSELLPSQQAQLLRLQRISTAASLYALCWLLMLAFTGLSAFEPHWPVLLALGLMAIVINCGFHLWVRTGRNLHARDPSLTMPQMFVATLWSFVPVYVYYPQRGEILMVYICIYFFGVFRLKRAQFFYVGAVAIGLYLLTIASELLSPPPVYDFQRELLRLTLLSFVLGVIAWVGGIAYQLRQMLRAKQRELERANDVITRQATIDSLTGLYNRRVLMEALTKQDAHVRRHGGGYAVIMCDLDHFKRINDDLGHMAGDTVLKQAAEILQRSLRADDIIGLAPTAAPIEDMAARYGGEEFVLLLPDTSVEGARQCAERMREQIARAHYSTLPGDFTISASFGVAAYRLGDAPSDVLGRADAALYEAKHAGRNRVVISP